MKDHSPRGLTISEAATYCGVTIAAFRAWVRDGLVPGPWPGTKRYDRKALDNALDKLSGLSQNVSAYDAWKAKQNDHPSQTYQKDTYDPC